MKIAKGGTVIVLILTLIGMLPTGCAYISKQDSPSAAETKLRASYHDFEDILIPSEMSLKKKNSFIYTAGRTKVGLLTFKGRVEPGSLAAFFQNNLPRDGWRLVASLKDRAHTMVFLKDDRACVISIAEKTFTTALEVRVGAADRGPDQGKGIPSR